MSGYRIDEHLWDPMAQRVKKGITTRNKEKASDINAFLNKACYNIDEAFKEFEVVDRMPTRRELEEAYLRRMQGKGADKKLRKNSRFWEAMTEFKVTESKKNSWQYSMEILPQSDLPWRL